jgi:HK97 family phage portal protein
VVQINYFNLGIKNSKQNSKAFEDHLISLVSADGYHGNYTYAELNSIIYSIVRILSSDLLTNRLTAKNKQVDQLLNGMANENMTAFDFKSSLFTSMLLNGDSFALIERDNHGKPIALVPLENSQMTVIADTNSKGVSEKITYKYTLENNRTRLFQPENIIHFKMLSDGYTGRSPIDVIGDLLGLSDQVINGLQQYIRSNGYSMVIKTHGTQITDETRQKIKREFENNNSNTTTAILDGDAMNVEQFERNSSIIAEAKNVNEYITRLVASVYGVSNSRLNIENVHSSESQSSKTYFQSTLQYYFSIIENELSQKLGTPIAYNLDTVLGIDEDKRIEQTKTLLSSGIITANEARQRLNLDRLDTPNADLTTISMNYTTLENLGTNEMATNAEGEERD